MMKNYRIDGSYGEITNKLEDKIQSGNGVSLRERSFDNLTNFIPKNDYLVESLNGIQFESLIKNEPNKMFSIYLQGWDGRVHIFQDKIITIFPSLEGGKYFLDILPKEILVDVNAVSTCINAEGNKLIFNSTSGVYFATADIDPPNVNQGKPLFKIEIPSGLSAPSINNVVSDVYYVSQDVYTAKVIAGIVREQREGGGGGGGGGDSIVTVRTIDTINSNTRTQISASDKIYIKKNLISALKIGDLVTIYLSSVNKTFTEIKITSIEKMFEYTQLGVKKICKSITRLANKSNSSIVTARNTYSSASYTFSWDEISQKPTSGFLEFDFFVCEVNNINLEASGVNASWFSDYVIQNLIASVKVVKVNNGTHYVTFNQGGNVFKSATYNGYVITQINSTVLVLPSQEQSETKTYSPYTPYILDNRLAVSTNNRILLSKVNDLKNFTVPTADPTEADSFFRTIPDVREITFVSKWGQIGVNAGFVIGTTTEIIFFSSIASVYTFKIQARIPVPCSYIKPKEIFINSLPANIVVENGRTRITAVIFTRDQQNYVSLTDSIDFFDTDKIKKIDSIKYGTDQLLFVLTENNKLYGCLTGGEKLAWFRIELNYTVQDITVIDTEIEKKLYIQSSLENNSTVNLVGFIDFKEDANKIKAEFFENFLEPDNIFSEEKPEFGQNVDVIFSQNVSKDFKAKLPKPLIPKFTLHNQEIINNKVNTKAERRMRSVKNVAVNVRNSNLFSVKFIYKRGETVFEKEIYNVSRNNEMLDPKRINELVKTYQTSPVSESLQLKLEGNVNSTIPLTIKSISFDTEYGNPR